MNLAFTGERMIPEHNRNELIFLEHINRYFFAGQFVANKTVLDIACGSGYGSLHLNNAGARQVFGIDNTPEAIRYAELHYQGNGIKFLVGDAEQIPLERASVDVVVSLETIEHLRHQEHFLAEIKRVVKPAGITVLSTPNALVHPKGNLFHTHELTPREWTELLKKFFLYSAVYFQDNAVANYILRQGNLTASGGRANVESFSLLQQEDDRSEYLMAVASDGPLPEIHECTALFRPELVHALKKMGPAPTDYLNAVEQERAQLRELANRLQGELRTIYLSRSWKIISLLARCKRKLTHLKKP